MKETELWEILVSLSGHEISLADAHDQICNLYEDTLDNENSEINKIGREIAILSDEEFESNLKKLERIIKHKNK